MRPLILIFLGSALLAFGNTRVWTDIQDRKIEAQLLKVTDDSVLLKLKDGREVSFPLAKLSKTDQDFAATQRAELASNMPTPETAAKPGKTGSPPNFDSPWPERITFTEDPEISIVEEDPEKKRFVYESANYQYVCDVRLSKTVVKGFAVMFEATNLYCVKIPISLNGGSPAEGKHKILLFEKKEDYITAGGPPSSAGVYIGRNRTVMVPLESLGVRPVGSGYMLDRDKDNKTLAHELVHQLTPNPYYQKGPLGWFTEGIAEYISITPYRAGSFNVRGNFKPIFDYVTAYGEDGRGGRGIGTKVSLPSLRNFMLQDYETFLAEPQLNYGSAALITTYFFHLDGEGDAARIKSFLKALHEGKKGEEALAVLLDGRTFEEVESEIVKAWSRKGVDFSFRASSPN